VQVRHAEGDTGVMGDEEIVEGQAKRAGHPRVLMRLRS
jgi:hypothetical protein